jgi:urease subunit beta
MSAMHYPDKIVLLNALSTMAIKNTNPNSAHAQPPTAPPAYTPPANPGFIPTEPVAIGGTILADGNIPYNTGRHTVTLKVRNTGDRPVQVGSHFHFFEINRYMEFSRRKAFGCHLNIPATTALRFEPGEEKEVELVSFGGKRRVWGFNGIVNGFAGIQDSPTYYPVKVAALHKLIMRGFKTTDTPCDCHAHHSETCGCHAHHSDSCTCDTEGNCTCHTDGSSSCGCNTQTPK